VYLPGIAANYLSVPDNANLRIIGDMDIRVYLAMDDWTPAAAQSPIGKYTGSGAQRSWLITIGTDGKPIFVVIDTLAVSITAVASVAPTITDGSPLWLRVAYDKDTGAGQYSIIFYTSTNGTTWTQLGTTITGASIGDTVYSTNAVEIGSVFTGLTNPLAGKIYRAQILNGIDGTTVLDVDTSVITTGADAYVVPTTYTGQAGAFFTGTGLSLNGVAGNYVSTPDASQIDITGDLDIQCKVALTDWTPTQANSVIGKYLNTGNQRSYELEVGTDGRLTLAWSTNGTTPTSKTSTVAPTVANGATLWIRVTLDVDNGASGNDVRFFTSDDGVTWTQLGDTVTTAGTTSIFSSSAPLEVGSVFAGTTQPTQGTIYRTIVKNGINGTTAFDANFETVSANALRMTESSTNRAVVTLNTTRYATINRATSGRKTVAVTQPTWLFGTDDYMEVNNRYMAHSTSAENYVYLSGAASNYISVSDNPPLDITGDLDIQVKVALDDWTPPSTDRTLVAKRVSTGNQQSYQLFVNTGTGIIGLFWSTDGGSTNIFVKNSTVAPTVADGATLWVRATLDVDNDAGGNDVKFYTSTDGITWTQLGSTVTTAGVTSVYSGTSTVTIGAWNNGASGAIAGKFYRAIIKNGIDGTTVLDADASVITLPSQTTFVDRSSNAYTVTINKSGVGTFVSTGNYLYLPGINLNYCSTPDSVATSITGDIDVRAKIALDDWTPSASMRIMGKWNSPQLSYFLSVFAPGTIGFNWSSDGTNNLAATSTVAPTVTDGATLWIRATLDVDNGAGGHDIKFFTSPDGITWTQLGTTATGVGTTSIFDGTAPLEVGTIATGTGPTRGKFFRAQVLNGIGGTVVFDANFESSITSLLQTSFTESSTNGATVTINRSGSTFRSAGVIDAGYLYPGATNTFSNSTTDFLNMGSTQSFTVVAIVRQWATPLSSRVYIAKGSNNVAPFDGYIIRTQGTALIPQVTAVSNGSGSFPNATNGSMTAGAITFTGLLVDRTAQLLSSLTNGSVGSGTSMTTQGSLSNVYPLRIGTSNDISSYSDIEFIGAAIFRTALTAKNISDINNYFQGRD
jgi:hypothetical protein